jgi:hypothetical protein
LAAQLDRATIDYEMHLQQRMPKSISMISVIDIASSARHECFNPLTEMGLNQVVFAGIITSSKTSFRTDQDGICEFGIAS